MLQDSVAVVAHHLEHIHGKVAAHELPNQVLVDGAKTSAYSKIWHHAHWYPNVLVDAMVLRLFLQSENKVAGRQEKHDVHHRT